MLSDALKKIRIEDAFHGVIKAKPMRFLDPRPVGEFFPIMVTGGIGDLIVAIPLIKKIEEMLGAVKVWSCNPRVLAYFGFDRWLSTDELFPGFKYWLKIETAPNIKTSGKPFIMPGHLGFISQWQRAFSEDPDIPRYAAYHPYCDGELARWAIERGLNRRTIMHKLCGFNEQDADFCAPIREKPFDIEPFITVHDGVDRTQVNIKYRSTKQWSLNEWKRLVSLIHKRYPHINIVQIGGPLGRPIPGVDIDFSNKLQIEQSLDLLGRSSLHIDGESGLVHAARAMGVKSAVMFGPTQSKFFGYEENISLDPKECGGCFWVNRSWAAQCPLYDNPKCIDSITAEAVFDKIVDSGVLP